MDLERHSRCRAIAESNTPRWAACSQPADGNKAKAKSAGQNRDHDKAATVLDSAPRLARMSDLNQEALTGLHGYLLYKRTHRKGMLYSHKWKWRYVIVLSED